MNPKDYFKNLLNNNVNETDITNALYKIPKNDNNLEALHFDYPNPDVYHQVDLLTLPNDKGYDLCLVVVDQGSRLVEAVALKDKSAETLLNAFKWIYRKDGLLKTPQYITSDQGTEFKGDCKKGLEKMGIKMIYKKTGRSRSLSLVERKNQTIGKLIHKLLVHNELATGKKSSAWIDILHDLIGAINDRVKQSPKTKFINEPTGKKVTKYVSTSNKDEKVVIHKYETNLLNVGDKVRYQLDKPQTLTGDKLIGKFRSSDIYVGILIF